MNRFRLISFLIQLAGWSLWLALPYLIRPPDIPKYVAEFHIKHFGEHLMYFAFYSINFYYLVPKFLPRKGVPRYLGTVLASMVLMLAVNNAVEIALFGKAMIHYPVSFVSLVPMSAVVILSTSLALFENWFTDRREKKILQEEKRNAELSLLRLQMSPHFLFNSLNNITALVRFDPPQAELFIHQLADLMRYAVRTTGVSTVSLEEELHFLSDYISLQKLRLPHQFRLQSGIQAYQGTLRIEPMLLVGFFENAFKHGISGSPGDFISLGLTVNDRRLKLDAANAISINEKSHDSVSGLGLKNIRKRLELVYPGMHELKIEKTGNEFRVTLEIELYES